MQFETKVVAVFSSNKALLALLGMVLSERDELRVRSFENEKALCAYLQAAPIDLLVLDDDAGATNPGELLKQLRNVSVDNRSNFQVIRLCRNVTSSTKAQCVAIGVDEVIAKPMSPKYLEDRVIARLSDDSSRLLNRARFVANQHRRPLRRSAPSERFARPKSNVVPIFGV